MPLANAFKLEKLKIESFTDRERTAGKKTYFAMFNPTSFRESYVNAFQKKEVASGPNSEATFVRDVRPTLALQLVLDGTGVSELGLAQLSPTKSVSERVKEFLGVAYRIEGETHQPRFLKVSWGDRWGTEASGGFECRLESIDIEYTTFDRDGSPLRAQLDLKLISDEAAKKKALQVDNQSPDLTHSRMVRSGDTLPLLAKAVYGSSEHYLRLAQVNHLNDFRNLTPGQKIFFPPLDK